MTLFVHADTFIQRHFDACVHWVMLTFGVSKGFVRYGVTMFSVAGYVGAAYSKDWPWLMTFCALIWFAVGEVQYRNDLRAESSGCLSRGDEKPSGLWKLVLTYAAVVSLIPVNGRLPAGDIFCCLASVGMLCLEYIKRTNPRPPEKRQRVLVTQTESA